MFEGDKMESSKDNSEAVKIKFKPTKKRSLRTVRRSHSDNEETNESEMSDLLDDAKELRKLRKRQNGVSAVSLAFGKKVSNEEELVMDDPFKMKTGGFIDMKALNRRGKSDDLDAVNLGSTFSAETNRRDEDADMMKYIEEELHRRKGTNPKLPVKNTDTAENPDTDRVVRAEDTVFDNMRRPTTHQSEEMLSNQMLSGIPEVDLGIEERIRNIEATEEAKVRLLCDRMRKKDRGTSFVPTNMAADFTQHLEKGSSDLKRKAPPQKPASSGKDGEKATDDFHFEKFKKQFRRF